MPTPATLTSRQKTVLQWVADGCPTDPEVPHTYKTTARSLAGHDLVKVKGSGKTWTASITDRGSRVLAGKEPLRKPKRKRGTRAGTVDTPPPTPPPVPTADEQELLERARDLMAELVASERNWVVRRTASKREAKTDWEPVEKIIRGPLKDLVPEGFEFSLHSHGESWYRESPAVVTAALLPFDTWVTPDTEVLLSGEKQIRKYHPLAAKLARESTTYSKQAEVRVKRLLHVLFAEAEARGWSVVTETTGRDYGHPVREEIKIRAGHRTYAVSAKERHVNVERAPTKKEVKDYEDSLRWSWNQGKEMPKYYDRVGTGLISITVGHSTRNDTEAKPTRLNQALRGFFTEIHHYLEWSKIADERDQIEADRKARRRAKATEQARVHHREGERHKILLERAQAWKERQVVDEYLQALEDVPEATEWLEWCRERLGDTGLLGETHLPMKTPFNAEENRGLIDSFERKLPEDESLW